MRSSEIQGEKVPFDNFGKVESDLQMPGGAARAAFMLWDTIAESAAENDARGAVRAVLVREFTRYIADERFDRAGQTLELLRSGKYI